MDRPFLFEEAKGRAAGIGGAQEVINVEEKKQSELLEQLYREHFAILSKYARKMMPGDARAEELVQDTFNTACEKGEEFFKTHPKPEGWLMDTLKNKIRNLQRRDLVEARWIMSLDPETIESIKSADLSVEELVEDHMYPEDTVMGVVCRTLKREERWHFCKILMEKRPHIEAAMELGITVEDSRQRISRMKKKLQKNLEEFENQKVKK